MKILIQIGHYNTKNNCDPYFRGMTGAPDEVVHNYAIGIKLADLLNKNGFEAHVTDTNINCPSNAEQANKDWDLFISLHCDANYAGDQGGGFVDYPDPSIDQASAESKRIKEAIESVYFNYTGIRNVPARSNPNTKFYYAWQYLTATTPCVILEMGESVDPHDSVILNDVERVATGILKGIQKAFPGQTTPAPFPPITDIEKLKIENVKLRQTVTEQEQSYAAKISELVNDCQKQKSVLIAKFIDDLKTLIDIWENK